MSHEDAHRKVEALAMVGGAVAELAKRSGYANGQVVSTACDVLTKTHAGHISAQAVQSLARYAPGAVVALGAVAPPLAIAAGVGYGLFKLAQWLFDD